MAPHAIVSYDDTQNDHDALMLGRMLRDAGAELTLAYVRHATHRRLDREQLSQQEADQLLERGARWLDDPYVQRRVVVSPSTGEGLGWLARQEEADLIVFGSEYRTPRGRIAVGRSAQTLLEGGPAALALAPAAYAGAADREIRTIGVLRGSADEAAIETAFSLAGRFDAKVVDTERAADLLIVGSRREARDGRVMITANAHRAIEEATAPVLVVARGVPLHFDTLVTA
jgi:nucleotide-binding universal stress UspA family protein